MKINVVVSASLGVLIMASTASAVFTGLFTEDKGTSIGGPGLWSLNVYARFDSSTDRVLSVTGASLSPIPGQQFYQNPLGGATEPNPALFLLDPDLQWDTFVTIGLKQQGPPGTPVTALEPGSFMSASGFTGGWFTDGDAPQGLGQVIPGQPGFYVLLMQLTTLNPLPTGGVEGTFTLAWKTASSGAQFTEVEFFETTPPAPATVGLMALAGMTYSRRRR